MSIVYSISALGALALILIYITDFKCKSLITKMNPTVALALIGLSVRLALSFLQWEYPNDLDCFRGWAYAAYERGFSRFYFPDNPREFIDYPPGYIYVLYIIGGIRSLLSLDPGGYGFRLLLKLPAIFSDLAIGLTICKLAEKRMSTRASQLLALAFLLNPAVLINSVIWGQVDSFYTLFIFLSLHFLLEKKYGLGFGLFGAAVLVKPQAFMFTPVYFFIAFSIYEKGGFKLSALVCVVKQGLIGLGVLLLGILPFTQGFDFKPFIKLYSNTLASYPYATLNAYNLYAFLGGNFTSINEGFLFFSYGTWGVIFINIIVLLSVFLLYRSQSKSNIFFVAALINILTFMFSVKMHERYLYPALVLLIASYIHLPPPASNKIIGSARWRILLLFGLFSVTLFINCADVLYLIHNDNDFALIENSLFFVSIINLILTGYLIISAFRCFPGEEGDSLKPIPNEAFILDVTYPEIGSINSRDLILTASLMAVYGMVAFSRLGNIHSPQTYWQPQKDAAITVDFGDYIEIDRLQYLLGARHDKSFRLDYSQDKNLWVEGIKVEADNVFYWGEAYLSGISTRYIRITALSDELMLHELAFRSTEGKLLPIAAVSPGGEFLFDEQQWVPETSDHMNSTYFDEIYHGRTAYEFAHSLPVYETTHPPLGKVLISWGISLLGMTPFGWRFAGAAIGVLMIPAVYVFAKRLFKNAFWASFAAFIFTFDFMHFTQTRIATIDSFVTFFIILMYYFMYRYYTMSLEGEPLMKVLPPLGLSGLFMGLAVASKWQGVYGGAGLAVIFFYALYVRYKKDPSGFSQYAAITLGCCLLFFIAVPVTVYCLSYIPFLQAQGNEDWVSAILQSQVDMFSYHAGLESEHPFSSYWWQWPFNIRPVFFYAKVFTGNLVSGISTFGNPAVWWMAVVSFFYIIHSLSKHRDKNLLFLLVAFLSQYVPWILISRTTYIYHYFPGLPFLCLMTAYFFKDYVRDRRIVFGYCAVVLFLFIMFYPVLSGMPVYREYVVYFLRWFRTWQLIT